MIIQNFIIMVTSSLIRRVCGSGPHIDYRRPLLSVVSALCAMNYVPFRKRCYNSRRPGFHMHRAPCGVTVSHYVSFFSPAASTDLH